MRTIAGALLVVGVTGFIGGVICSLGGLNWFGPSFEWPIGIAEGVVRLKDGTYAVPHTPSSRVQLYDRNWKYLKGWQVDASGGTFKLQTTDNNQIHVITARGQWRHLFDFDGRLLLSEKYTPAASYYTFPESQEAYYVPTPPWLLSFTHPFRSWGLVAIGMITLFIESSLREKILGSGRRPD